MSGKAVRNIKPIKDSKRSIRLSVIIPSATQGNRMKSVGPRSLIQVGNISLFEYQMEIIREVFPNSEFIIVSGFDSCKLMNRVPKGTICVENERYAETNVLRSIGIGLRAAVNDNVLILYGDTIINRQALDFSISNSCIVYDTSYEANELEVGCTVDQNKLENIFYGLGNRWTSLTYLTGKELSLFKSIAFDKQKEKLYTWEAINEVIEKGGTFSAFSPKGTKSIDIDCVKDMESIEGVIR